MNRISTKKIVMSGLMIALVFIVTKFTSINTFVGYFNVGDVAIMIAAVLLGKKSGFVAGAVGSALADLLSPGYQMFAPVTFVVKGLEGYVVGLIVFSAIGKKGGEFLRMAAVVTGSLVMIGGYFLGEAYVMNLYASNFGYAAAVKDLVTTNLAQGGISAVVGYAVTTILVRAKVHKYILE